MQQGNTFARVAGIDITADEAITLMSLAHATASMDSSNDRKAGNANSASSTPGIGAVLGMGRKGVSRVARFLTDAFALEYRPWLQFLDVTRFRKPQVGCLINIHFPSYQLTTASSQDFQVGFRDTITNLRYWAYNYAMLSLVVFVYSLLTNPILILCFLMSGGVWVWLTMVRKEPGNTFIQLPFCHTHRFETWQS